MSEAIKFLLPDDRIPKAWYNLVADLPQPLPPVLNAATGKPIGAEELTPLFPMSLILQEVSTEREIEIPDPVRESTNYGVRHRCGARGHSNGSSIRRLASSTKTKAQHPRAASSRTRRSAEAFYSREAGAKKLVTLTGAGQWGSAIAFAGAMFGLEVKIFMVRVSYRAEAVSARIDGNLWRNLHPQPKQRN